jgi:hypothetical protein
MPEKEKIKIKKKKKRIPTPRKPPKIEPDQRDYIRSKEKDKHRKNKEEE